MISHLTKNNTFIAGQCSCFQHYTSEDCSVDTQKAPVLEASDDDSVCDTAISGCSYLNVYGDNFFNTGSHFKCRLEEQKVIYLLINQSSFYRSKLFMFQKRRHGNVSFCPFQFENKSHFFYLIYCIYKVLKTYMSLCMNVSGIF